MSKFIMNRRSLLRAGAAVGGRAVATTGRSTSASVKRNGRSHGCR